MTAVSGVQAAAFAAARLVPLARGAQRAATRLAAGVLLAVLALLAHVAVAADARLPDGTLAVPPLARVTDSTGTLGAGQKQALEAKLAAFEKARGTQIAIVMVGSTQPEPISDFAQRIGDAWKIGRHDVGDGLLVVVAKEDRKVWIAVAKALEGAVPDIAAARVIREAITPRFRQGDFAGGLGAGLDAIFRLIEGEGLPQPGAGPGTGAGGEDLLTLLAPFVMFGVVVAVLLRKLLGVKGALLGGAGTGTATGWLLSSTKLGLIAGVAAFFFALFAGSARGGRVVGGRRGGVFVPGGWSGGGGGGSSAGGGWSSGGGGNFGGGGAGGSW